jgi:hypothetical protein
MSTLPRRRAQLTTAEQSGHHALCVYEARNFSCYPEELHHDIEILERAVTAIRGARRLGDIAAMRAWADDLEAQHGTAGVIVSPSDIRARADRLEADINQGEPTT